MSNGKESRCRRRRPATFLGKVGTDMQNIQGELEKLFCYTLHRDVITPEDIDAVCINQIGNHIFEMVNAVAEKKQRKALDLYYELLALKEPPMRILFLLVRQYRILFHVQSLQVKGYGRKEIAAKAGLHPFAAGKYMEQTRYFKMRRIACRVGRECGSGGACEDRKADRYTGSGVVFGKILIVNDRCSCQNRKGMIVYLCIKTEEHYSIEANRKRQSYWRNERVIN